MKNDEQMNVEHQFRSGRKEVTRKVYFASGNHQGKKQEEGMLGYLDDYLYERIDKQLSINITRARITKSIEGRYNEGCG